MRSKPGVTKRLPIVKRVVLDGNIIDIHEGNIHDAQQCNCVLIIEGSVARREDNVGSVTEEGRVDHDRGSSEDHGGGYPWGQGQDWRGGPDGGASS